MDFRARKVFGTFEKQARQRGNIFPHKTNSALDEEPVPWLSAWHICLAS